jgi:hypothetical protein
VRKSVQRPIANRNGNAFVVQLSLTGSTQTLLGQGHDAIFGVSDSSGAGLPSVVVTSTQSETDTTADVSTNERNFYVSPTSDQRATRSLSLPAPRGSWKETYISKPTKSDVANPALQLVEDSQPVSVAANASQVAGTVYQVNTQSRVNDLPMNDKHSPQLVTTPIATESLLKHNSTIPNRGVSRNQLRAEMGYNASIDYRHTFQVPFCSLP